MLFVVLDNVRADRLSLCGHDRPTSPTLQALADAGARVSCDATAPGTWTLPSHASFFTGVDAARHGAHYLATSSHTFGEGIALRPLGPAHPTLAERMAARGYQTASLSGNPLLRAETGLTRGFGQVVVREAFPELRGGPFIEALRALLDGGVDPQRPLFLFLNIADAHQPWDAIPEGHPWLPPRPALALTPSTDPMRAFLLGRLPLEEGRALRAWLADVYDGGVWRADRTLASALDLLRARGWLGPDSRLVITSDHGEFLGEHGLLDHGRYTWEADVRVPVLAMGPGLPERLPHPLSALDVHALVLDGALPRPAEVKVAAWPDASWLRHLDGALGGHTSAALRLGDEKLTWVDGALARYDLAADPGEARPLPLPPEHPGHAALLAWAAEVQAAGQAASEVDPALLEALEAAGYVEPRD